MVEFNDVTGREIANWTPADSTNSTTNEWSVRYDVNVQTPHVSVSGQTMKDNKGKGIHPRLYFKYIKNKFSRLEDRAFKKRMKELEKMVDEYAAIGQEALSEECIKEFMVLAKESAIYACNIRKYITEDHVEKYRYKIKNQSLKITPLKNFARIIPPRVAKKIKQCIDKKLFDTYEVFHLDALAVKETQKEKVERERDPIVFGKIQYSDKYYFIADWEDEMDDLRLTDIIKKVSIKRAHMTLTAKIEKKDKK